MRNDPINEAVKRRFFVRSFDLRKALFILPNAFTLASVFCGVYAILHLVSNSGPEALYQSSIAIFFAGFFDMFDGRVARLTRTQSEFGTQMDSLADAVSFGVAPAVLVYVWALWSLNLLGLFASFCYAACGIIRLARFNVMAAKSKGPKDFFIGLPIPFAAAMVIALVMAHYQLFGGLVVQRNMAVLGLILLLSVLMVSNVPYWSFKRVRMTPQLAFVSLVLILAVWAVSVWASFAVALVLLIASYIFAGFVRYVLLLIFRQGP